MRSPGPIGGDLLARRYRLIDRVGSGGMSVVWRARDEVLDRLVAVKWLGSELADDDLYRDLVRREAWATARIKHPAVAAVYDYGEVSDSAGQSLAYVVMEMMDGESLSDRLRRGPLPWPEAVAICAQVADALATAHEHGVVHRDVSPDNVMLTSSGLRVFDFGIAAPVGEPDDDATGSTFGTPAYVAPERLDGSPAQTATDVYSLGVLLFEMLTGQPPFPEDTWNAAAPLQERLPPRLRVPGLPAAVAKLCQRCLAHDPAQRPSAREVAHRLAAVDRPRWRGPIAVSGAVAAVATAVALTAFAVWPSEQPRSTPTPFASGPAGTPTTTPSAAGSTASPTGTTSTTEPPAPTGPPSAPAGGQQPPVASVPVEQALDELGAKIDTISDVSPGGTAGDMIQDFHNYEWQIRQQLLADPDANVRPIIEAMADKIDIRWGERRLSNQTRTDLKAALAKVNQALGYPPL